MRLEEVGVGGDGFAVGAFGGGGLVQGVLGEAEIVEEVGVVGSLCGEGGEELQGRGVVLAIDGGVGFCTLGILRLRLRLGGSVDGASGELGVGEAGRQGESGEYKGQEAGATESVVVWCRCHVYCPFCTFSAQSIQKKRPELVL